MEELLELRELLQQGKVDEALLLVDELEDMSLSDKINKIDSYGVILLVHLIKQQAERSTRSGEISSENAAREIKKLNKRHKAGDCYLSPTQLSEILQEGYQMALRRASAEAFEGRFEAKELESMVDQQAMRSQAIALL